ncbi:MAG: hypothetical protein V1746_05205 [bacterium]
MALKIVHSRGVVVTAEKFRASLDRLIAGAVEASNTLPQAKTAKAEGRTSINQRALRQEAAQSIQTIGLNIHTKAGQAAAGAAMLTQTIAAGLRKYEEKSGKPAPREAVMSLEHSLTQLVAPVRGKVQDIRNPKPPKSNSGQSS